VNEAVSAVWAPQREKSAHQWVHFALCGR